VDYREQSAIQSAIEKIQSAIIALPEQAGS
jgi:hypothetical protein